MKDLTSWVNRCTLNVRAYTVKKEISNAAYAAESEVAKTMQTCIRIHPKDSVAVALQPLSAGTWISESNPGQASETDGEPGFLLKEDIPAGHKFALADIPAGSPIIKYGEPIGTACADIPQGAHVHTHNLKTALDGVLSYTYHPRTGYFPIPIIPPIRRWLPPEKLFSRAIAVQTERQACAMSCGSSLP